MDRESVVLTTKTNNELKMHGDFNLQNAGLAEAVLHFLGVGEKDIEMAFREFAGVPGRMEFVQEKPFGVIVDYAHTPDSLEAVYTSVRKIFKGNIIAVLGSMGAIGPLGGRDRWKRPKMGEIAEKYCKEIILTDEDPVDEDPAQILEEIEMGIRNKQKVRKILYRTQAIKIAI